MDETMIRKYPRTNVFVIDDDLWAWAQYRAKTLERNSVSEYIFDLIRKVQEKAEK